MGKKKLNKFWSPAELAVALRSCTGKAKAWSSSCSASAVISKDSVVMEHEPEEFESEDNPAGVGPYFGTTLDDGLDPLGMLHVFWADGKTLKIRQTFSWLCPPPSKKPIRVKVGGQAKLIYVVEYTKRGVKVLLQDIHRKGQTAKSTSPKSPKAKSPKAKSPKAKSPKAKSPKAKSPKAKDTSPKSPPAKK